MAWYSIQAGIGPHCYFKVAACNGSLPARRKAAERLFRRLQTGEEPLSGDMVDVTGNAFRGGGQRQQFKPTWFRVVSEGTRAVPDMSFGSCPDDLDPFVTNLGDSL